MNTSPTPKILIAASGTGGHLLPALYIARALQRKNPNVQIEFVGSGRPLEEKIIGGAGITRSAIKIVGINKRGIKGIFEFLVLLPKAFIDTWAIITRFRPTCIIGVGGYASVLPVTLGFLRGIPTWVHEPELKPGLANSFLARIATKVSVAFAEAKMPRPSRVVITGHPVREEIREIDPNIPKGTPITNLLVTGGSQGAQSIDDGMISMVSDLQAKGISVWHQCRIQNVDLVTKAYEAAKVSARVSPFIDNMAEAYKWAHVVVGRAGAGTLMEYGAVNRPAVLVPYPSKGIQQSENAKILESQGKALVVEEGPQFMERFKSALITLFEPERFFQMHEKPCLQRVTDAADKIADGILGISKLAS